MSKRSPNTFRKFFVYAWVGTCLVALPYFALPSEWKSFLLNDAINLSFTINPPENDLDMDDIENALDNCPNDANPDQIDSDDDGVGDACQPPDDNSDDSDGNTRRDPDQDNTDESTVDDSGTIPVTTDSTDDLFAALSPTAVRPLEPFEDVPVYNPRFHFVQTLKMHGIVHGINGEGKIFAPERTVTRAELLKISLVSARESGVQWSIHSDQKLVFTDVPENHSLYPYIQEAVQNGIVHGYPDGTFRPDNAPTFGETVKILLRSFNETQALTDGTDDLDQYLAYGDSINLYAHINKSEKNGLVPRIKTAVLDHQLMHTEDFVHTQAELEWFQSMVREELATINAELALLKGYQSPSISTNTEQVRAELKIKLDGLRTNIEEMTR